MSRSRTLLGAAFAISLTVFVPLAFVRLIVRDEGFYLIAAEMATAGQLPYLDFFYPQMPLVPYLYGIWIELFGHGWIAARLLSAVLAAATGALLFDHLGRRLGARYGALALALYLLCDVVLAWYSVVKSYAAVSFLLFVAYLAILASPGKRPWIPPLAAGLCIGLAVNSRLILAAAIPLLVFVLVGRVRRAELPRGAVPFFATGLALALAPSLVLMATAFDAFWFDNLGYHLMRSNESATVGLGAKFEILLTLAGIGSAGKGWGFQLPLLLYANLFYIVFARLKGWTVDPACWLAAVLLAANFAPSPAYVQYFSVLVPILIVPAVRLFREARSAILLGAFLVAYVVFLPSTMRVTTTLGDSVPGPNARTRSHVVGVTRAIEEVTEPGETVYASWPGFLFGSHARPVPGSENQFGMDVAERLDETRRRELRIVSRGELRDAVARGEIRVLVLPDRLAAADHPRLEQSHSAARQVGKTTIHVRRE